MRGYNLIYPVLVDMFKSAYNKVWEWLGTQKEEDKVLRFPAGSGGRKYIYDRDVLSYFLEKCKRYNVKYITFVFSLQNPEESNKALKHIREHGHLEVILVELGNEEYFHARPTWNDIWDYLVNRAKFMKDRATKYVEESKEIYMEYLLPHNYKVALCSVLPNSIKNKGWDDVIMENSSPDDVTIYHPYGFTPGKYEILSKCKTKIGLTEYGSIDFGYNSAKNRHLYMSPKHFSLHNSQTKAHKDLGDKLFVYNYHALTGGEEVLYARIDMKTGEDLMNDFDW